MNVVKPAGAKLTAKLPVVVVCIAPVPIFFGFILLINELYSGYLAGDSNLEAPPCTMEA